MDRGDVEAGEVRMAVFGERALLWSAIGCGDFASVFELGEA